MPVRVRQLLAPLLLAVALAVVPGAASARPGDCAGAGPRTARDLPLVLPDGTRLTVRDPYGGRLPASRPAFRFSVRGAPADLAAAGTVRWYLDDRRAEVDEAPPFVWSGRTSRLGVGRHTITVQAFPEDGLVATTSFRLRVTGCSS